MYTLPQCISKWSFCNRSYQFIGRCNVFVKSVRQIGDNAEVDVVASKNESKPFEEMPGPRSFPLIGSMHYMMMNRRKSFNKIPINMQFQGVKDFGKIHKLVVPGISTPLVQLADLDEVAKVFYTEPKYPKRLDFPVLDYLMEEMNKVRGVFFSNGHDWYRHRSVISKRMLRPKEVAAYLPMLNEVVTDFMDRLEKVIVQSGSGYENEVKNLNKELFNWSFESIAFVLLERRLGCLEDEPKEDAQHFINAIHNFLSSVFAVSLFPLSFYKYYKTESYKMFKSSFQDMYKYAEMFIDMRVNELQAQNKFDQSTVSTECKTKEVGFFEFLIANGKLSREDILASVIDLLFAGVETTSNTILWALYMLGKNPRRQEQLHQEIASILKPEEVTSAASIANMPYLKAWIKETLRLYPVLPTNTRQIQKDMVLGGYQIPAGTHINILSFFLGHDETIFKDANDFVPERWMRNSDNSTQGLPNAFASLPFGFGTRMCVGRRIAEMEMYLLLARIVHKYQILYPHADDVEPTVSGAVIPEKNVRVKFIRRDDP